MKKTTKTLFGIGGALCLIGILLFGIGFASGGTTYVHATNLNSMNAQSGKNSKENNFKLEKTELSDFDSLDVNLKDSDFNIKESPNEKSYIEYVQKTKKAKNPLSYSVKNNTLTLRENGNSGASYHVSVDISFLQAILNGKNPDNYTEGKYDYANYVTLYLPKNKLLSSAKINLNYGDLLLKNAAFDTTDIKLADGDLTADTFTAGNGDIALSYGDCSLDHSSLGNVKITSDDGDISADNLTLTGSTNLSLSYGDAEITLTDSTKEKTGYDLSTDYGDIHTSKITGNKTSKNDGDTNKFQADSKDGTTNLTVTSADGDIIIK